MTEDEHLSLFMRELSLVSREEWFEVAQRFSPKGMGANPMRALQMQIRTVPSFPLKLLGVFHSPHGLLQRLVEWPRHWAVARLYPGLGFAKGKVDLWRKTEPLCAQLEALMEAEGPRSSSPNMLRCCRQLISVCTGISVQ